MVCGSLKSQVGYCPESLLLFRYASHFVFGVIIKNCCRSIIIIALQYAGLYMQCAPAYREVCIITTWVRAGLVAVTQVAQVACFNITVFTLIPTGTNLASLHKTVLYYVMTKPIRMRSTAFRHHSLSKEEGI